jgi:hypothetical protein
LLLLSWKLLPRLLTGQALSSCVCCAYFVAPAWGTLFPGGSRNGFGTQSFIVLCKLHGIFILAIFRGNKCTFQTIFNTLFHCWACRSGSLKSFVAAVAGQLLHDQCPRQLSNGPLQLTAPLPPQPIVQSCMGQCYYCARGVNAGDGTCYMTEGHRERYPGGHICRPCLLAEHTFF